MSAPYIRAPHQEGSSIDPASRAAPNAALLVDFDNVTMGMRSDLSKELKNLLGSDIIRGKVTVQRAYADWRRYPQYIVPLSEASIDLIFAPAYGSSKKNATDIRMAIDGMELVFTRPEIGTYILLTGDSDFSSLVLKLKEYGKYVIGVGIQESSSDILVQNCDEYYSYTSLTGLRKTTEATGAPIDPWVLVEKAVERMVARKDVMRSDRLKQVMLELDSGFDEGTFGFSKFSRFLSEAASRGLLRLRKLENGQYEISPSKDGKSAAPQSSAPKTSGGRGADAKRGEPRSRPSESRTPSAPQEKGGRSSEKKDVAPAYDLLCRAVRDLADEHGAGVRDSDVKRRMLAFESSFDETEFGFSKFSRFLRQAHDDEVIDLKKGDDGHYQVAVRDGTAAEEKPAATSSPAAPRTSPAEEKADKGAKEPKGRTSEPEGSTSPVAAAAGEAPRLRPRTSSRRSGKGASDQPPPLLEGQVVSRSRKAAAPSGTTEATPPEGKPAASAPEAFDPQALKLPTDADSVAQYLSNSYKGVGKKTAESLAEEFGVELFQVLHETPQRIDDVIPARRADKVREGWEADYERRKARLDREGAGSEGLDEENGPGGASGRVAARAQADPSASDEADSATAKSSGEPSASRRRTRPGRRSGRS